MSTYLLLYCLLFPIRKIKKPYLLSELCNVSAVFKFSWVTGKTAFFKVVLLRNFLNIFYSIEKIIGNEKKSKDFWNLVNRYICWSSAGYLICILSFDYQSGNIKHTHTEIKFKKRSFCISISKRPLKFQKGWCFICY